MQTQSALRPYYSRIVAYFIGMIAALRFGTIRLSALRKNLLTLGRIEMFVMSSGKQKYYAVRVGLETGIFSDWPTCQSKVKSVPGAKFKSFKTKGEAEAWMAQGNHQTVATKSSGPQKSKVSNSQPRLNQAMLLSQSACSDTAQPSDRDNPEPADMCNLGIDPNLLYRLVSCVFIP